MKLQKLLSYTRRAVEDYDMIKTGDKIAVGISGGKDSLALLYVLHGLQRFYKHSFDLHAITVDMGYDDFDLSAIQALCDSLSIPYTIVKTQIRQIVFDELKESNPCSLCAKMRRGALNNAAKELGCTRIALGHHKEDVIETTFMSQFFEGRYYCFPPVTHLDRTGLFSIRPLIYTPEMALKAFKHSEDLPVVANPCPVDGHTKREAMKQLLLEQNKLYPGLSDRLFHALQTSSVDGWQLEKRNNINNINDISYQ